jgi:hypothetical protein
MKQGGMGDEPGMAQTTRENDKEIKSKSQDGDENGRVS